MARDGWMRIGECGVDSGQLYIIDPCYLRQWDHTRDYQDCMDVTLSKKKAGEAFDGIAFATAWGDGSYPVFARYETGRVMEVRVCMDGRNFPDGSEDE